MGLVDKPTRQFIFMPLVDVHALCSLSNEDAIVMERWMGLEPPQMLRKPGKHTTKPFTLVRCLDFIHKLSQTFTP